MMHLFQHLDTENSDITGRVTKLIYIDDVMEPNTAFYAFDDNTRCRKDFIAPLTTTTDNIKNYMMAQVVNQYNIWQINVKEVNNQPRLEHDANGNLVEIPNLYGTTSTGKKLEKTVSYTAPRPTNISNPINENSYKLSTYLNALNNKEFNIDMDKDIINDIPSYILSIEDKSELIALFNKKDETPKYIESTITENNQNTKVMMVQSNISEESTLEINENIKLNDENSDANDYGIYMHNCPFTFTYNKDTSKYEINCSDKNASFNDYFDIESFKSFINVEDTKNTTSMLLDNYDPKDIEFISNMINKSNKKNADAAVDINIDLPPTSVYQLLKTAFPSHYADAFVKLIAHNVPVESLQNALAEGLKAYYDELDVMSSGENS